MNGKIIFPVMVLLIVSLAGISGAAPAVYAEEINEASVVHEAPPRESNSGPVIAPAPEDANSEPLVIAPKPIEHDASNGENVIAPAPVMPVPDETDSEPVIAPAPDSDSLVVTETDEERPQIIGGNRDEHGCLGTAGYLWDEESQACVRPWSGEVQSETVVVPYCDLIGLEEPTAANGQEASEASFIGPLEMVFDAIAGFFQGILSWFAG